MLHIHFGNRIERLADALAEVLARPTDADPLRPETIVVGHAGMDEWLKRALAARRGIAANLEFQQPAAFVWRMLRARDPALSTSSPLERGPLVWRLYAALVSAQAKQAEVLARYLAAGDERAPFELAEALATVFEQYQIYRPEWIRDWQANKSAAGDAEWQAALWQQVAAGAAPNPAQLYEDFARHADRLAPGNDLPARVSVFGISALAPVYLQLLAALAQTRDVFLFVPNPSQAYWGDIESEKRLARWRLVRPERTEYAVSGHPLLSALGMQTRDFIELLHDVPGDSVSLEHFELPPQENLLGRLQNGILNLVEPEPVAMKAEDESVQIHVCHSRQREVEVLHDALLACFEADPSLGPEDILVMAPNMDDYAEPIGAVFGAAPHPRHIPWSLADRSLREEHPIPEALLDLLALPDSRFKVSEVIGLLELPAVARRFGLDTQSLADVRRWVETAGIRWGLDGAQRAALGLPGEDGYSWRFGFDRLLLGYALAPDEDKLWKGVAPWGAFEGQTARPLGPLCVFVAQLAKWRANLEAARPLAEWTRAMQKLLALFAPETPDELAAVAMLRQAVKDLAEQAQRADYTEAVPRTVARAALAARLAVPRHPRPFLSGRVTFCALAPMRSIPAKIVWLLGMSEQDFPRRGRPPGFDLIAADPKRGDRARRTEDRALFLEALGAARNAFHVSYIGRSERDDTELPPSVVVSELLDVLKRMGAKEQDIVLAHPLQPFSARYRAEPRRGASYAEEWLGAPASDSAPAVFAQAPIVRDVEHAITLDELARGLSNPARQFLNALGAATRKSDLAPEDEELFSLHGLDAWRVRDALLELWLTHGEDFDPNSCYAEFAAHAWLPLGEAGRLAFADIVEQTARLIVAIREVTREEKAQPHDIDLQLGDWHLQGRIADVYPQVGLVRARAGKVRAKDRLDVWIRHLALAASDKAVTASHFIGMDKDRAEHVAWGTVADPRGELIRLCELYARIQREAVPLLPELSLEFDQIASNTNKGEAAAYANVESSWNSDYRRVDGAEDYELVFRGCAELFDREFGALARDVFGPMADAETKS
ncbi:MAG: exodeoxyribonuclease V subunit gamma [Gammaproteobacteria bacterium]